MESKMSNKMCIMCKQNIDKPIQFGEKITFEDVTAHYYCLLLSSNLKQTGEDDEGIYGFMPIDIKNESERAKRQRCCFCRKNGANISCCTKKCRRAFHFTCGSERNCHFEFVDPFKSFCEWHSNVDEPLDRHQSTDSCMICHDQMGEYNPVQSIRSPCCKATWFHKLCLQEYADKAGYFLKCPCCNDSDRFRPHIAKRGVFIPDRDAVWEETGTETETFYGFAQHIERPKKCVAENCELDKHQNIDEENELVLCEYCGSNGVHESCLGKSKHFICDDCKPLPSSKRQRTLNEYYDPMHNDQEDMNNNIRIDDSVQKSIQTDSLTSSLLRSIPHFTPIKLKFKLPPSIEKNETHSIRTITNKTTNKRKRNAEI